MKSDKENLSVDERIGQNLKAYRKLIGLERKEMAEAFHITDDALYRIEKGQNGLTRIYAYILATEFRCDMNFIFGGTEVPELVATEEGDIIGMLRRCADILERQRRN